MLQYYYYHTTILQGKYVNKYEYECRIMFYFLQKINNFSLIRIKRNGSITSLEHKYCVFFLKIFVIFLNCASSAAPLVFYLLCVCTYTDTEGKKRRTRVRNILKSLEKTQYLMNTLYNRWREIRKIFLIYQMGPIYTNYFFPPVRPLVR